MNRLYYALLASGFGLCAAAPVLGATCTVPNAISNGQVADASKVMDNFNAIAGCAQLGVTTTGTPSAGAISVFSGSGSIAAGNLTGDVTTSGSTSTTLSNSGVVAGLYTNPTLTIDAKGRITNASAGSGGSGGGGASPSSWQQVNLSSTPTTAFGRNVFASAAPITVAAGQLIEVEVYATKLTTNDLRLFLSTNGTTAYEVTAQGDNNIVNYRTNGTETPLGASGASTGQNWNGLFRMKIAVLAVNSTQNVIWSVTNDQRVPLAGVNIDSNYNMVGPVTIYVMAAAYSNIQFVRMRITG